MWINEVRTLPHTIHKIKLKIAKCKTKYGALKLLGENTDEMFSDINHRNIFLGQSAKTIKIKAKMNKWDLIKPKNSHSKGNHKQNERTTYGLREKYLQMIQTSRT